MVSSVCFCGPMKRRQASSYSVDRGYIENRPGKDLTSPVDNDGEEILEMDIAC